MMDSPNTTQAASHSIEVFFDGDCPLCTKEIAFLRRQDRRHRIRFTDITAGDFRADSFGLKHSDFMNEIQGRTADGVWITGVEVFRRLYEAVGWGPVVWCTRLPGIRHCLSLGYRVFAKNRLKWTGRSCRADGCAVGPNRE